MDARISGLCDELSSLQEYLEAVHKTLDECRSLQVAPAQPDLWQRCDEALKDCLLTLSSLKVVIDKIKDSPPAKGKGLRWRAKAAVDLSVHGDDLAAFREKVHKNNIALQTMLHTITVYVIVSVGWDEHRFWKKRCQRTMCVATDADQPLLQFSFSQEQCISGTDPLRAGTVEIFFQGSAPCVFSAQWGPFTWPSGAS